MTFETFKSVVDLWKQTREKCNQTEKAAKSLFDSDTTIMFYWPLNILEKSITITLSEVGMNAETTGWFLYEGLPRLETGEIEVGVKEDNGEYKYYIIKNLEDYFNFEIAKNYSNLEIRDTPKDSNIEIVKSMDILAFSDFWEHI